MSSSERWSRSIKVDPTKHVSDTVLVSIWGSLYIRCFWTLSLLASENLSRLQRRTLSPTICYVKWEGLLCRLSWNDCRLRRAQINHTTSSHRVFYGTRLFHRHFEIYSMLLVYTQYVHRCPHLATNRCAWRSFHRQIQCVRALSKVMASSCYLRSV